MLDYWLAESRAGRPVWLPEVRQQCAAMENRVDVTLQLTLWDGTRRDFPLPLPRWQGEEQRRFALDYAAACVYNALCGCGGRKAAFYLDEQEGEAAALLAQVRELFLVHPTGYGKTVQIARRFCRAFGAPPFAFTVEDRTHYVPAPPVVSARGDLTAELRRAVARCHEGVCVGLDIGGTDIKGAVSRDGALLCVKEFDWNPAAYATPEEILRPIVVLARLLCACAAGITPELQKALAREATVAEMEAATANCACLPADVMGVSFPDIVLRDRIIGGETPKTHGMRCNPSEDYETAFERLGGLLEQLRPLCRPDGALHMTNDGHIAAFTAAAELAWGESAPDFGGGVIAHAIGTDFGMGYLTAAGTVPEMPLELYDFILDLGSFAQRQFPLADIRGTRNENSGLAGARRYLGQAAAFRLAYEEDPALLADFVRWENGVLTMAPEQRKPCLAYLMAQAAAGNEAAANVFRRIGRHIGQISREMALLLRPETDTRYLFGRFVKEPVCFDLLAEGCRETAPHIRLERADEDLAETPLTRQLAATGSTVAQFGQSIGAMYYAALA